MRLDAHSCALGKAILAYKSRDELREIYKSYTLHKHTSNTITSLDKLYLNLDKVRKKDNISKEYYKWQHYIIIIMSFQQENQALIKRKKY